MKQPFNRFRFPVQKLSNHADKQIRSRLSDLMKVRRGSNSFSGIGGGWGSFFQSKPSIAFVGFACVALVVIWSMLGSEYSASDMRKEVPVLENESRSDDSANMLFRLIPSSEEQLNRISNETSQYNPELDTMSLPYEEGSEFDCRETQGGFWDEEVNECVLDPENKADKNSLD